MEAKPGRKETIKLEIRLFGALEEVRGAEKGHLELEIEPGARVADVFERLGARLGEKSEVLRYSALANEERVLDPDEKVTRGGFYAVLPPVCGG